jgi:hypothetical protein
VRRGGEELQRVGGAVAGAAQEGVRERAGAVDAGGAVDVERGAAGEEGDPGVEHRCDRGVLVVGRRISVAPREPLPAETRGGEDRGMVRWELAAISDARCEVSEVEDAGTRV